MESSKPTGPFCPVRTILLQHGVMESSQPKGPFCQSCSMPMEKPEDFGTNADGSRSQDYCHFCFQGGKFTDPNINMEQMIDRVSGFMAKHMGMAEQEAKEIASQFIPQLKRWRK